MALLPLSAGGAVNRRQAGKRCKHPAEHEPEPGVRVCVIHLAAYRIGRFSPYLDPRYRVGVAPA